MGGMACHLVHYVHRQHDTFFKVLEGGKATGGQITDQRFCGRILEGELRFNMVNNVCLGVIHKVPAPGGMSAVGGTGSVYEFYDNNTLTDQHVSSLVFEAFVNKEKSAVWPSPDVME